MYQKPCIEGVPKSPNPHRSRLSFFLITHNFVDIDENRSALSVKDRITILKRMDCLTYFHGTATFILAIRLSYSQSSPSMHGFCYILLQHDDGCQDQKTNRQGPKARLALRAAKMWRFRSLYLNTCSNEYIALVFYQSHVQHPKFCHLFDLKNRGLFLDENDAG